MVLRSSEFPDSVVDRVRAREDQGMNNPNSQPFGVVPAPIVIGEMSERLHDYRVKLLDEIGATEERLKYLTQQKNEVDNFLSGDVLKMWAREREQGESEPDVLMDEGPGKWSRHG